MSQLRRIRKRKSERALEGGQDCVAQRNLLGGRGLGPSRAPPWQGLFPHFMGGEGAACVFPQNCSLPALYRCGSIPRCGRASSSAVNAPSPRASKSSCSCHPSSWVLSLTSAQSSGSPCWPMSAPSPPTRYPKVGSGGWPMHLALGDWRRMGRGEPCPATSQGLWRVRDQGCPQRTSESELSRAPHPALPLASTHSQLHHDHPGGHRQAGGGGQGSSCRAPGRGEGLQLPHPGQQDPALQGFSPKAGHLSLWGSSS